MAEETSPTNVGLPDKLRRQFAQLEGRLLKVETAAAMAAAVSALAASYLLLFLSDRLWDSPVWLRLLLLAASLAVVLGAALGWAWRWLARRRDLKALSDVVQRRHRRLGDRLLGIVELANESKRPPHFSPELYEAAIRQVAAEAGRYDFRESVDSRPARRMLLAGVALAALALAPLMILPAAARNAFHRWVAPAAAIERYTLVSLEDFPGKIVVAHGETFELSGSVHYRSFWRPARATGRYEQQPRIAGTREGERLRFEVPGQAEPGRFSVRIGDARREIEVVPRYRPSLRELTAAVDLPEYLRYPEPLAQDVQNGSLTVIEGSTVAFAGSANRELTEAALVPDGLEPVGLSIDGMRFASETVRPSGSSRFSLTWRDHFGLRTAAPMQLLVQTRRDAAPIPEMPGLAREIAMLESDVLRIRTAARDDFGVSDFGLSWDLASDLDQSQSIAVTEVRVQSRSPDEKRVEEVFQWSPRVFRIPPDTAIELRAFARDLFPGRERVETPVYRIYVLGRESHAELIRQRLESLLARVEEVTRLEEKILARTLEAMELTKMDGAEAAAELASLKEMQLQNASNLAELSKEGVELLREAMRNSSFSEASLEEWARNLQEMQDLAGEEMQQAATSLDSARQQRGESRSGHLAEAAKSEQEILDALERLQGKVNDDLDDLQAMTLAQRLRKMGTVEAGLGQQILSVIPDSIGLLPRDLPEAIQRLNAFLGAEQETVQGEAGELQNEIHRFFERTRKENYGTVNQEMADTSAVEELDRLRELIVENVGMEASRNLDLWSGRFMAWADLLEPPESEGGGGEGGGEGESPNVTKQLIALLRLREQELTLHRQTRLLDEHRGSPEDYTERAGAMSGVQGQLRETLGSIQSELPISELNSLFEETSDGMKEIELLLGEPRTDDFTQQAQIRAVELLTDIINLINEQAQRMPPPSQGSGSRAEDLAFLLQMMAPGMSQGMEAGDAGGGSTAGGDTARPASPFGGEPSAGRASQPRRVDRAAGSARALPVEFRETLENYFRALEREEP